MPSAPEPRLLDDLELAEECRDLLAVGGAPLEIWELLCLIRTDREGVRAEVKRLKTRRDEGRTVAVAHDVVDRLNAVRTRLGQIVRDLRALMAQVQDLQADADARELIVGFMAISTKGVETLPRWLSDPERALPEAGEKLKAVAGVVQRYREALQARRPVPPPPPPEPEPPPAPPAEEPALSLSQAAPASAPEPAPSNLPPGVDAEILEDLRRAEEVRRILEETRQRAELWEIVNLVTTDRDAARSALDELQQLKRSGHSKGYADRAFALFKRVLDVRTKHGRFIRELRSYIAPLPMAHYSDETMQLALGFVTAAPRLRETAQKWLNEPRLHRREAAGGVEDVVRRTLKYQSVLRQA